MLSGTFSGETLAIGKHGFLTGDSVVYSVEDNSKDINKLSINPGIYYVKKENDTEIKLSLSRENIFKQKFVSIASTSIDENLNRNTIILAKFSKGDVPSSLDSQKIVRLLSDAIDVDNFVKTPLETPIGVLQNGVEILNYKSKDKIYYGAIESVEVLSSGRDYDVINPPVLNIKSPGLGFSSCKAYCGIDEGYLKKIDIVDGGFDYIDNPVVVITGGGGEGATAVAKMIDYEHFVDFNSSSSNKRINLVDNIIGFSTYHRFRDGENVIYSTNKSQAIGGLSDESSYFVSVIDEFRIKLHTNLQDSLDRSDEININSFGLGNHLFKSRVRKRKINSILVTNPGYGYKTKKISVSSSGINTFTDTINVYENPFNDKELIYYYGGDSNIGGLSTGRYIATKVNDKSFKLSEVGVGNTDFDFYHKTKQYINFTSSGQGNHIFDYEPFSINIIGKTGISTYTPNVGYAASVNAHFKGKVSSIFVHDGGTGYGSTEILNYNAQPEFSLDVGEGAEISPIILDGKIQSVVVKQSGKNYNSPPNLIISGSGSGAILTPIIENGKLIEVKVINTGANYSNNTYIQVLSWGQGCRLKFYPQTWTVNNVFRLLDSNNIPENDSIVYEGNNEDYGLQYTHSYSPRSLRKKIF